MSLDYNPQGFASMDLRKFHVRDIKDVLRFIEFTNDRMDECKHVINKFVNRAGIMEAVVSQMQRQQQKINDLYGLPSNSNQIPDPAKAEGKVEVQKVEEKKEQVERTQLLDELRQAVANETTVDTTNPDARITAVYEKYKMVKGKQRDLYYREGKMVSAKDVPDDVKAALEELAEKKTPKTEEE